MRTKQWGLRLSLVAVVCFMTLAGFAQESTAIAGSSTSAASVVPGLVNYSGVLKDINGKPLTELTGATFSLYKDEQGGAPIWIETQNVTPDRNGRYTVTLGATKSDGTLADSFSNGEPRWLGVQVAGQQEQPRVLLVAVPYALKAGDAETIGGLPPSAFVLANSPQAAVLQNHGAPKASATPSSSSKAQPPANPAVTGKGTLDFIPMWDTASDIVNSVIFQKTSEIGIGTTAPAATLDVNGKSDVRDTLTLFPKSTDNTLAVSGTTFKIDSAGKVTFISGQTFPGAGTITGVTTASASGLQGGGTTGTLSLSVKPLGITNAMLQNSKVTIPVTAPLTGGGAVSLGTSATALALKACAANQIYVSNGTTWSCAAAGTGTITGITTANGSGLAGGGTSGTLNLSVPAAGISNAMLQNSGLTLTANTAGGITTPGTMTLGSTFTIGLQPCAASQILQFSGSAWSCASVPTGTITGVLAGTDLTGGGTLGTVTLNLDTTKVPLLAAANNFTANQTVTGSGSGFAMVVTPPAAASGSGLAGNPALYALGSDADSSGLAAGGVGLTVYGGIGGTANTSGNGGNAINAGGGSAGNGNGGVGISAGGGFGIGGDLVIDGNGGAGVVATGGDSEFLFGGDGIDATGGAGGQGNNFASTSGNGVVGTGGAGGFQEADGTGGVFTGGTAGGFGGFGIEVFAGSDSAAFFSGDIIVTGAVNAGTKDFKIDHPLDPANKYLYHASVESSEMMNIYTGNVTTDAQGDAQVQLPDWFEAVNADFRYQLTVIGQFAQAIVSRRLSGNQFAIKTDKPNVDVSWQITAVRQDAFAKAHPLVVEEQKNARERGFYLHPELYGAAAEKGIAWSHHPDTMRRVKAMQQHKPAVPAKARPTSTSVRPASAVQK